MPDEPPPRPCVLILMGTRQGARWLPGQLASIAGQTVTDWQLWVSDDGSTDATPDILAAFAAARPGQVRLVQGPRSGSAQNYLALLTHPDLPSDRPVALSDQDDVWYPEKLARGLALLDGVPGPAIYGGQSRHIDSAGRPCGQSRRPVRPVTLGNAAVQNMVSGHSLMLNPAAAALARAAGRPVGVAHHDWWLSLLVIAAGGRAVIDDATVLDYRQHGHNAVGAPGGAGALLRRGGMGLRGQYRGWFAANIAGLAAAGHLLDPPAQRLVDTLSRAPSRGPGRVAAFVSARLHRQRRAATLAILLAALCGLA